MELDFGWIEDAMANVNSSASTAVVVETADPMRNAQLVAYLIGNFKSSLYMYDPWNGLRQLAAGNQFLPVRVSAGSGYDAGLQNEIRDLEGALRHMDGLLRQHRAAFILTGMDCAREEELRQNQSLINAVRAWALDEQIMTTKSAIWLVTAKPGAALDTSTLELVTLVRPKLASEKERHAIVCTQVQQAGKSINSDGVRALTLATAGLNLHQTQTVLRKTYNLKRDFRMDTLKHYKADYIRRSDVVEIEEPTLRFADVGGYEKVKDIVRRTLILALQRPERARLAALALPRGLLLFGPPGTGKTLFAKALAAETNLPFINMKTENLFTKWLGESGQRVKNAIQLVEQASPALVFIDEIDRFGKRTSGGGDGASQETGRVFAQMLEWLGDQNRKAIVVGTTNVPEHLDPAFLRPGRFSYVVPFLYPEESARLQILQIHLGLRGSRPKPAMEESTVTPALALIARETNYYAGADLEELVIRAKQNFFQGKGNALTGDDLYRAHQDYRIDVSERVKMIERYKTLGPAFANSLSLLQGTAQP